LENVDLCGMMILKLMFRKLDVRVWIEFIWLRILTSSVFF